MSLAEMRLAIATSHPIQYYAPLFRELAGRIDIHVFYAHRATPRQQAAAGFGEAFEWDVDLLSGYEHSFLANVSANPGTARFDGCDTPEIGARLSEGGFDALLVFGWNLKSSIQAIIAAKRRGLPVVVRGDSQLATQRSTAKRLAKGLAYPVLLRAFDAALYVGKRSKAYYEHYRYPAERLFFSPHAIDTAWFGQRAGEEARAELRAELNLTPADRLVLFAGKLLPFKRPLDVVEAAAVARRSGAQIHVAVAGSGELEAALAARAEALGVPLHPLGFQNQSRMPRAYAGSDLLMLPSDARETWGLVSNEALACGRPILVSAEAGCAEDLAGDGLVGLTHPVGDIAEAAAAMERLLAQPPARAAIEQRSRAYSLSAAVDGVISALAATAGSSQARGDAGSPLRSPS